MGRTSGGVGLGRGMSEVEEWEERRKEVVHQDYASVTTRAICFCWAEGKERGLGREGNKSAISPTASSRKSNPRLPPCLHSLCCDPHCGPHCCPHYCLSSTIRHSHSHFASPCLPLSYPPSLAVPTARPPPHLPHPPTPTPTSPSRPSTPSPPHPAPLRTLPTPYKAPTRPPRPPSAAA